MNNEKTFPAFMVLIFGILGFACLLGSAYNSDLKYVFILCLVVVWYGIIQLRKK